MKKSTMRQLCSGLLAVLLLTVGVAAHAGDRDRHHRDGLRDAYRHGYHDGRRDFDGHPGRHYYGKSHYYGRHHHEHRHWRPRVQHHHHYHQRHPGYYYGPPPVYRRSGMGGHVTIHF